MKTYRGTISPDGKVEVVVAEKGKPERPLTAPFAVGAAFGWGDGGAGATVLARALLLDALDDEHRAAAYYQRYKHRVVVAWNKNTGWQTTSDEIARVVAKIDEAAEAMAPAVTQARQAPAPVVSEVGAGIQWDKKEALDEERTGPAKQNPDK